MLPAHVVVDIDDIVRRVERAYDLLDRGKLIEQLIGETRESETNYVLAEEAIDCYLRAWRMLPRQHSPTADDLLGRVTDLNGYATALFGAMRDVGVPAGQPLGMTLSYADYTRGQ